MTLCFAQSVQFMTNLLSQSDIPSWLILIVVILGFLKSVYNRWLKHVESMDDHRTTRFNKLVDGIVTIAKSNNLSKSIRSIAGKKEQVESFNKIDSAINKTLDTYIVSATEQVMKEFENMNDEERAPVCEVEKAKQINFLKKKEKE